MYVLIALGCVASVLRCVDYFVCRVCGLCYSLFYVVLCLLHCMCVFSCVDVYVLVIDDGMVCVSCVCARVCVCVMIVCGFALCCCACVVYVLRV